ncbi:hypothetical protein Pfo_027231 [Paulownia fortunei]|nr:hypothetical protein Pfo_027231 [Paulownia fortunei]
MRCIIKYFLGVQEVEQHSARCFQPLNQKNVSHLLVLDTHRISFSEIDAFKINGFFASRELCDKYILVIQL